MNAVHASTNTYGDLAIRWLATTRLHIKESSYAKYVNLVHKHILPVLGEYQPQEVTTHVIEGYIMQKLTAGGLPGGRRCGRGLSAKSVKDILCVLHAISRYARCIDIEIPCHFELIRVRVPESETRVLTREEQNRLEQYLLDGTDAKKLGILLSLYMGLRVGELCALQVGQIDLDQGVIHIQKTMQRLQNFHPYVEMDMENNQTSRKTRITITEPKSRASIRTIPIPPALITYIQPVIDTLSPEAYLLTQSAERYIEPRILEDIFNRYLTVCEIPRVNYHVLRHTFATRCIECGFDAKTLSKILGHASVNITLNRYVHTSLSQMHRCMATLVPTA